MSHRFKTWNATENTAWRLLAQRQLPNLEHKMCRIWFDGWKQLTMPTTQVPDFDQVSQTLTKSTGWKLHPTSVVFADGQTWFQLLKRKTMIISDYIRPMDSLDYTPMPDVFHDAFGHLPFFTNQQFCTIVDLFARRMLSAKPSERQALGHIWWFSVEFGLIKERGQIRAFGAGLASSFGELNKVFTHEVELHPFEPDTVAQMEESHHTQHQQLFFLESLDQLEDIARNWTLQSN